MSNNTSAQATVLSPYGAHKLVNAALEEAGLSDRIPPQMMYNYTSGRVNAGKAPFIAWNSETGVDRADLDKWMAAYVAKKVANKVAEPADPEQAEFDESEAN